MKRALYRLRLMAAALMGIAALANLSADAQQETASPISPAQHDDANAGVAADRNAASNHSSGNTWDDALPDGSGAATTHKEDVMIGGLGNPSTTVSGTD